MLQIIEDIFSAVIKSGLIYFVCRELFNGARQHLQDRKKEVALSSALFNEVFKAANVIVNARGRLEEVIQSNRGQQGTSWIFEPNIPFVQTVVFDNQASELFGLISKYDNENSIYLYALYADFQNYNEWVRSYRATFIGPNSLTYKMDPNIQLKLIFDSMGLVGAGYTYNRTIQLSTDKIKLGPPWAQALKNKKALYSAVKVLLVVFFIFIPRRTEL